jgi:O-acetyl-ADP-ribose deacetylase (regulator of RNase III)
MTINYTKGDATQPTGDGLNIIMHIVNNYGGWGAGFVIAISRKWKEPEQQYRNWHKSNKHFELGAVQFVKVNNNTIVANMLCQDGYGGVAVKYDYLRSCLEKVCEFAKDNKATVHAPRIGTGLGGGKWEQVEPIIEEELCQKGVEVTIYDFQ